MCQTAGVRGKRVVCIANTEQCAMLSQISGDCEAADASPRQIEIDDWTVVP